MSNTNHHQFPILMITDSNKEDQHDSSHWCLICGATREEEDMVYRFIGGSIRQWGYCCKNLSCVEEVPS